MMLVTVGSSPFPFDRLLRAVDNWRVEEEVVVQHGPSAIRPRHARCIDYLSFDELGELVRGARVVVMHAGVGSILTVLAEQRQPVVVPRQRSFGEAVDDHQVAFARRAHELGLVTLVEDIERLPRAVEDRAPASEQLPPGHSPIEAELRRYIEQTVGLPARRTLAESREQ
jgi:UDP-N-acetylglucosamine transferase subunit ALG13